MSKYIKRQDKLINSVGNNSIIYIYSNNLVYRSNDEAYPFSLDNNFYYLTGLTDSNMILEISMIDNVVNKKIYAQKHDPIAAKWVGDRLQEQEIINISGINNLVSIDQFDNYFTSFHNNYRTNNVNYYLDLYNFGGNNTSIWAFNIAKRLFNEYGIVANDIHKYFVEMRQIKDQSEVDAIIKSIDITKNALYNLMTKTKINDNEMLAEAYFNFGLMEQGCKNTAFSSIIASGKNATVLHYNDNNSNIKDNTMLLCDLGARYNYYSADITRTFPVSGKFTTRQKELYNLVLEGQLKVIENAREGITLKGLNQILIDHYKENLHKYGLDKDVSEYYFHSVSHMLGLDTHDIDNCRGNTVLKRGMVITAEPGLYVEDEEIGIRIEDDILITDDKAIVLSKDIVKTVEDIERLLNK